METFALVPFSADSDFHALGCLSPMQPEQWTQNWVLLQSVQSLFLGLHSQNSLSPKLAFCFLFVFVPIPIVLNFLLFVCFVLLDFVPLPNFTTHPLSPPYPSLYLDPSHMIANLLSDLGFQTTHEGRESFLLGHLWDFVHLHTERLNVR